MPKTKEQAKEENDEHAKRITELALQTRNWARRIGAYIDDETDHHGYFTVDEWRENFGERRGIWRLTKRRMVELGMTITHDSFGGHFLGKPGSQMVSVAVMLKSVATQIETMYSLLEAAQTSGQWDECLAALEEKLEGNRHHLEIGDIPKLLTGAGMPMRESLQRLLLPGSQN